MGGVVKRPKSNNVTLWNISRYGQNPKKIMWPEKLKKKKTKLKEVSKYLK